MNGRAPALQRQPAGKRSVGRGRFWFVGVDTSGSSAVSAFPGWMDALGMDATLEGIDVALDADDQRYVELVRSLRLEADVVGTVITAHKARLFESAHKELDGVTEAARLCREVSVLRREDGRIVGDAIEPRSVGCTLSEMLSPDHWRRTDGELVVLGAGGTASAMMVHLFGPGRRAADRPGKVRVLDIEAARAEALAIAVRGWSPQTTVTTYERGDAPGLMRDLPAGSLLVNATGLGKDRPGSPVPQPVDWPAGVVVWDLNYRGELAWLRDAQRASRELQLRVHDGWLLFLHGWAEALGSILGHQLTADQFERLSRAAERTRRS